MIPCLKTLESRACILTRVYRVRISYFHFLLETKENESMKSMHSTQNYPYKAGKEKIKTTDYSKYKNLKVIT